MSSVLAPKDRIIIALDVPSPAEALRLVTQLDDSVSFYKVGLELYAAAGMAFVRELLAAKKRVFLDLKLYDIGETVKRTTAVIADVGVDFLTVHAVPQVMRAAQEGKRDSGMTILGVTVLTSLDDQDLRDDGHTLTASQLVDLRVKNALAASVGGLVCSPLEVERVAGLTQGRLTLVTPGVRSQGADTGDQKRVATPAAAVAAGATYIVVGREVTRSEDPKGSAERIAFDIAPKR
jgi:orotidine-5'-phosphate decarboxylase